MPCQWRRRSAKAAGASRDRTEPFFGLNDVMCDIMAVFRNAGVLSLYEVYPLCNQQSESGLDRHYGKRLDSRHCRWQKSHGTLLNRHAGEGGLGGCCHGCHGLLSSLFFGVPRCLSLDDYTSHVGCVPPTLLLTPSGIVHIVSLSLSLFHTKMLR